MENRADDRVLAALLADRTNYDKINAIIDPDEHFAKHHSIIIKEVMEYYDTDVDANGCDVQYIKDRIADKYPKHIKLFEAILDRLPEDVSGPNIVKVYQQQIKRRLELRISETMADSDEALKAEVIAEYTKVLDSIESGTTDDELLIGKGLEDVLSTYSEASLVTLSPQSLNDRLGGGLVPGTVGCVFALTEMGKSLFMINMACSILRQGYKVLYVGNEDPADAMLRRFYTNLAGMTNDVLRQRPMEAQQTAYKNGYGNLLFYPTDPGTIGAIVNKIEKHKPHVLIIDQMHNLSTKGSFSKVDKNEHLACKVRSITKRYNLITIVVHQAAASAYGKSDRGENNNTKLYLELSDMYYSNVGIQSQLDWMLGIGADPERVDTGHRGLSLCKNKLGARREKWPVYFDNTLTKVNDIWET